MARATTRKVNRNINPYQRCIKVTGRFEEFNGELLRVEFVRKSEYGELVFLEKHRERYERCVGAEALDMYPDIIIRYEFDEVIRFERTRDNPADYSDEETEYLKTPSGTRGPKAWRAKNYGMHLLGTYNF